MRALKGLTLVELLLLIIVILLTLLLLSCTLGSCNSNDWTARCASNLDRIGHAMYIYAQDEPGVFPAIAQTRMENDGLMRIFDPEDRVTQPSTTGVPSPTVDMWAVVRAGNVAPRDFICPWTSDQPDPALWPQDYYDFLSADNLSNAYQYQHDPDRNVIGTSSDPGFPFVADGNPYIKGGVTGDFYLDRLSETQGNSTSHRSRQRGQNVLYQDGHVELESTPGAGLYGPVAPELGGYGFDNIYTVFSSSEQAIVDPGSSAPSAGWCNLGGRSDACLVP